VQQGEGVGGTLSAAVAKKYFFVFLKKTKDFLNETKKSATGGNFFGQTHIFWSFTPCVNDLGGE
jgi:hypothetical protein